MKELLELFKIKELQEGHLGIEREGLRCDGKGVLAQTLHPRVFGEKLFNPYITTDFSESQLELITPVFQSAEKVHSFLEVLYDITVMEIGEEYIWPQSMPCSIPVDEKIPVATFCECPTGQEAHDYRKKLLEKYGGKKQLVSGIHYNFSFPQHLLEKLYKLEKSEKSYKAFREDLYLKVARNYLRYRWLLIYLLGSTSVLHESYVEECVKQLEEVGEEAYANKGALSYRNSDCGYTNKVELFPDYTSVESYIKSIEGFIHEGLIESHKELYSQIRLKAKDNTQWASSLRKEGILYLEYRSIDINPFDKAGIQLDDLHFMHLFNLFLLFKEESEYESWQEEALANQKSIAGFGQEDIHLLKDGVNISKSTWGFEILEEMKILNEQLQLGKEAVLEDRMAKIEDYKLTYAYRIMEKVKQEGYLEAHLKLARHYKQEAYHKRYKLTGYEDMELSTQIVIKEAIKRGISFEIIDRSENFIRLEKGNNVQYIKQATKTSQDNYVTVLMMENKTVTKEVLDRAGMSVPKGNYFDSLEAAREGIKKWVNHPLVVKPKSTNFGLGISIFPEGGAKEDLEKAIEIAFGQDQSILIETFIKGKEYRFLVINDEVVGVLHRVPANVVGDGTRTIRELVAIKNQDTLRGEGYKTPLEKIHLDESAELFLKQMGKDFETVPYAEERVYLRENSNISTGGDSIDYTDRMPDTYKKKAVEAAKAIGAKICGVDMMIQDYTEECASYAIIELNFNPAIHIHCYPYQGEERNIASHVLNLLGY